MSRKSAAALSVVPIPGGGRTPPPADLSAEERAHWVRIVDAQASDWFNGGNASLLLDHVRALALADLLTVKIAEAMAKKSTVEEVALLMRMRDTESRRAMTGAVKLRLTNQSRYTPQAAGTASKKAAGARPWDATG